MIDWTIVHKGMKGMTSTKRIFVSKWCCDNLGTGKNLVKWKHRPHGNCPFCLSPDEDTHHILSCQHSEAMKEWYKQLDQYLKTLTQIGTCPVLVVTSRYDIIAWKLDNKKKADLSLLTADQKDVIIEQRRIGWHQFLQGLMSKKWIHYHDRLFLEDQSKKQGLTWAAKVYRANWTLIFNLWTARNSKLHDTKRIEDMEGSKELELAIENEWKIGIGALPAAEFSYLLNGPLKQTLKRSLQHKRSWLAIIRQGRVMHDDPKLIKDDGFMFNGALRFSLGLPPVKMQIPTK